METQKLLLKNEECVHVLDTKSIRKVSQIIMDTFKVKTINGEVQLKALVDGKKIIVTEASVRRDLQLNDEEGTDCFPNATIFEELTRMGYEKLSQKLTFYKAFFSPQWKFLIHTILQCLSAKTTAWNEFSRHYASGKYGDEEMFDTDVLDGEGEEPSESITTTPTLTTTTAAIAITTVSTRPKAKGLVIHEEDQATTPTVSSQQPSQLKVQDKGKGKMVELEKPMKKKELIRGDEEIASKLQAEFDNEVRLARKKAEKEKEANIVAWDNVQAMINAHYQMAKQMKAEEQEEFSIEEKSKLFVQLLEAKKKHFVAMRAQE
ncbi:hypothetical protein Tco_1237902 [Tanacetum coccineum]